MTGVSPPIPIPCPCPGGGACLGTSSSVEGSSLPEPKSAPMPRLSRLSRVSILEEAWRASKAARLAFGWGGEGGHLLLGKGRSFVFLSMLFFLVPPCPTYHLSDTEPHLRGCLRGREQPAHAGAGGRRQGRALPAGAGGASARGPAREVELRGRVGGGFGAVHGLLGGRWERNFHQSTRICMHVLYVVYITFVGID